MFQRLRNFNEYSASLLLMLLLCADFAFITVHIINAATSLLNDTLFSIGKDGSYSEIYQYIKYLWIVILLICISKATKSPEYTTWVVVFSYFLFDDALQIHEKLGGQIANHLDFTPPLNLRLQDLGELAVSGIAGALLLSIVAWSYLRGSGVFKKATKDIVLLVLGLAFFGIFIDVLHSAIKLGSKVNFLLGVIEDGGEMVFTSLMLWYVFLLSLRHGNLGLYLSDLLRTALTNHSAVPDRTPKTC